MIRSSKHPIKFANYQKRIDYLSFLKEYRRIAQIYLDYLWDFVYVWEGKDSSIFILDVKNDCLDVPKYFNGDKRLNLQTPLSARAVDFCVVQVLGCLKAATDKRRKQLFVYNNLKAENQDTSKLEKKFSKPLTKPRITNINPEMSSKCCDYKETKGFFDGFIQLKSIGKVFEKIKIPIKYNAPANKWRLKGKVKTSFLFSNKTITIRWEIEEPKKKEEGLTLGADQGKIDVLVLSNDVRTKQVDNHGHSLSSIIDKLARKKKGSKAFRKAQSHRQNFINHSINQLNLTNVKLIKLEKIVNINFKKRVSRKMKHWCNPLIRDKLIKVCEETGVQIIQQSSTYRSQRCSSCGLVRKANRKGKVYNCSGCGMVCDADLNAAKNHEQELPNVPTNLRKLRRNLGKGFLWKPTGFFEITGEVLRVPSSNKQKD